MKTIHSTSSLHNNNSLHSVPNKLNSKSQIAKPRILVIDDEAGVVDMIHEHFSLRGYEVFTALDGSEGVEVCRQVNPDVILLDLKMKTMDGDKAVPFLRDIVPQAKIFVISAYQDEITQKRIAGLNIDAYFEKPVSILELEKVILTMKHSP